MEDDDVHIRRSARFIGIAERNSLDVAAALAGGTVARVVHENPPHHDGRQADELCAILPVHLPLVDQPEVRLVDECGGLERVVAPLAEQIQDGHRRSSSYTTGSISSRARSSPSLQSSSSRVTGPGEGMSSVMSPAA